MKTLPKNILELTKLAIADLEKVEKDPNYRVDMGEWHTPSGDICLVCLAGAVMSQTFEMSPETYADPRDCTDIERQLHFLNDLRAGYVAFDDNKLYTTGAYAYSSRRANITPYRHSKADFKHEVLAFAERLEREGYSL